MNNDMAVKIGMVITVNDSNLVRKYLTDGSDLLSYNMTMNMVHMIGTMVHYDNDT